MVKTANFIHSIQEMLDKQDIKSVINEKAIDNKIDTLFIPFEGTDLGLTMTFISADQLNAEGAALNVGLLQYHIAFPLNVDKNTLPSVSEFVHRLNLTGPIPGWILDRAAKAIHFRSVQIGGKYPPSEELVSYFMRVISFYMMNYVPILIDLCLGRIQLEEAIKKLQAVQ